MIYFDHNATTPLDERVLAAMQPFLTTFYGNPSALYRVGRIVRSAIDTAREQVAALVGVAPTQVVFTSGGTEANNLALQAVPVGTHVLISQIEHPSVIAPAQRLQRHGCVIEWLKVDGDGVFEQVVSKPCPSFASLMLANNETGVIQNVAYWAGYLREQNAIIHTDAVQAAGKIPVSFDALQVHLMSLSGHKIYGPKGSGALIIDKDLTIEPLLLGGGQEQGLRAGTENVAAIVGFGKAAELARAELNSRQDHCLQLRRQLEQGLTELAGVVIFSEEAMRLPNTVQFGLAGCDGEMLQMQFDKSAIAVSSGSACASGGGQPSPVLTAMGISPELAKSVIRVSLGQANTSADVTEFIDTLRTILVKQTS